MITLHDIRTKSLVEIERIAYATDDGMYVSIKMVRELIRRAMRERDKLAGDLPSSSEDDKGRAW